MIDNWLPLKTFLAKGPRYICTYALWRGRRALARRLAASPRWPDDAAAAGLYGRDPRAYFLRRERPAPLVTQRTAERVVATVPASERERTCRTADEIAARLFRYRGHAVSFAGGAIDWQACPDGNTDWTWDLNRHHFAVELGRAYRYFGNERYAETFRELFLDWFEQNPPGVSAPAWRSVFEVGVRAVNWCWTHALFLPSPAFDDELHGAFLRGLLGAGSFLRRHLERHAWNNHLLLEAKALAMLGVLYPELPGAASWASDGLSVLAQELRRQVCDDGVHSERSTFYHKLIASELLEMLVVLRLASLPEREVAVAIEALCGFLQAITRDDGSIPLLGDASRHDAHVRFDPLEGAAVLLDKPRLRVLSSEGGEEGYVRVLREGTAWLLAALDKDLSTSRTRGDCSSVAFPEGGFWVLRANAGGTTVHLLFDCGPFGDAVVSGHGHADALSVDLAVGTQHALVDPGMYSAHLGEPWRNHFRGTAAHNTVRVDERDQSVLRGVRRVYYPARARCTHWRSTRLYDHVRGEHDGYRRLSQPVRHEREIVFLKPDLFLIVDRLDGEGEGDGDGEHLFERFFHFPPGASIQRRGDACEFRGAGGYGVLIAPLSSHSVEELDVFEGRESPPAGWVAYRSGIKEPAPTARYRLRAPTPLVRATVLAALFPGEPLVAVSPLRVERGGEGQRGGGGEATRLKRGSDDIVVLSRAVEPEARSHTARAGEIATDARLLFLVRRSDASLHRALLIGGSFLEVAGVQVFPAGDVPADYAFDGERWTLDGVPLAETTVGRREASSE